MAVTDDRRSFADRFPRERAWTPRVRERPWNPPRGYVPYLLKLQQLPPGRPYGTKVIVAEETHLEARFVPGIMGRIASEQRGEWIVVRDDEVLVDFGARGVVPFPRRNLRVDQI